MLNNTCFLFLFFCGRSFHLYSHNKKCWDISNTRVLTKSGQSLHLVMTTHLHILPDSKVMPRNPYYHLPYKNHWRFSLLNWNRREMNEKFWRRDIPLTEIQGVVCPHSLQCIIHHRLMSACSLWSYDCMIKSILGTGDGLLSHGEVQEFWADVLRHPTSFHVQAHPW
jgi:hypothetical protein